MEERKNRDLTTGERDLFRIIMVSNFLAFGGMGALLYSWRVAENLSALFSPGGILAFAAAGGASLLAWLALRKLYAWQQRIPGSARIWMTGFLFALMLAGAAMAISGAGNDFWTGIASATAVLAAFALLFIWVIHHWGLH